MFAAFHMFVIQVLTLILEMTRLISCKHEHSECRWESVIQKLKVSTSDKRMIFLISATRMMRLQCYVCCILHVRYSSINLNPRNDEVNFL